MKIHFQESRFTQIKAYLYNHQTAEVWLRLPSAIPVRNFSEAMSLLRKNRPREKPNLKGPYFLSPGEEPSISASWLCPGSWKHPPLGDIHCHIHQNNHLELGTPIGELGFIKKSLSSCILVHKPALKPTGEINVCWCCCTLGFVLPDQPGKENGQWMRWELPWHLQDKQQNFDPFFCQVQLKTVLQPYKTKEGGRTP